MRRSFAALLAAGVLFVAACSDGQAPTTAAPSPNEHLVLPPPNPCQPERVGKLIPQLFTFGGGRAIADVQFIALALNSTNGKPKVVRAQALALVDFTLKVFKAGALVGGKSPATAAKVTDFLTGVLCLAGLPPFSLSALDPDAAAAVVMPNSPTTNIVTGTGFAGMQVPTGAVSEPTLLTITRLPDSPGPLLTQFDQYPAFYEFSYNPATTFNVPVVVATCVKTSVTPPDPSRLRLAHNIAPYTMGSIEILDPVPAAFVDCTNAAAMPDARPQDLAHRSFDLLRSGLAAVVLPQRLEAMRYFATGGLSGSVRTFSPFGGVDTLAIVTPTNDFTRIPAFGDFVEILPEVVLTTPTGNPLSGFPINWTIAAGGGAVSPPSTTTDAAGHATVTSWQFGFTNPQQLTATAILPPHTGALPYTFQGQGH